MSRWLDEECRAVVASVQWVTVGVPLFLFFKRGEIRCAPRNWALQDSYELVNAMPVPRDRTESELVEWVKWQVRNLPCFP